MKIDRRKMERFVLSLPGLVTEIHNNGGKTLRVTTRDVCAGGAFFQTDVSFPVGTVVHVDIELAMNKINGEKGKKSVVQVAGEVIRIAAQGMAVRFDEQANISPL